MKSKFSRQWYLYAFFLLNRKNILIKQQNNLYTKLLWQKEEDFPFYLYMLKGRVSFSVVSFL